MYVFRVKSLGNDADCERYLNQMERDSWAVHAITPVGEGGRVQFIHFKADK